MKERENELTNQPNSPKLSLEGDIFMVDENGEGMPSPKPPESGAEAPTAEPELPLEPLKPTSNELHESSSQPGTQKSGERRPKAAEDLSSEALTRMAEVANYLKSTREALRASLIENNTPPAEIDRIIDNVISKTIPSMDIERGIVDAERKASSNGENIYVPRSLEELATLIMQRADPEWRKDGPKALIENGRVNTANFLDWARNNMLRLHNFNPVTPIRFFEDLGMGIDTNYRTISFYEIVFTRSFFLDKDPSGKASRNPEYEALREQMLTEVFLFQMMRNGDLGYVLNRPIAERMLESLAENFVANPLTRGDFMEFIFTMPSIAKRSFKELNMEDGSEITTKRKENFYMGDAIRTALTTYINIFDYKRLNDILGPNSQLFQFSYEGWNDAKGERERKENGELKPKQINPDVKDLDKRREEWFYTAEDVKRIKEKDKDTSIREGDVKLYILENGKPVEVRDPSKEKGPYAYMKVKEKDVVTRKAFKLDPENGLPLQDYMNYLNIFLLPMADVRQQTEIRQRIVLSIKDKTGISYKEAQLAEAWAYSMTHMTGIAAVNDTQAVGFDAWTKLTRFREYRKRQRAESRNASYGGKYNLEGLKRIALPFIEGARDLRGRTVREIIQGGKTEINLSRSFKDREEYRIDEKNGYIVLVENGKNVTTDKKVRRYEIQPVLDENEKPTGKRKIVYFNAQDEVVELGNAQPVPDIILANKVEFNENVMRQFAPNHVREAQGVYEQIMKQVEMDFPSMVIGYDSRGGPILDRNKVEDVKNKIEHFVRYSLSTWPEINYGDEFWMPESQEVRNKNDRLVNKAGDELDEDWYVLKNGRRTDVRSNPDTYVIPKPMTILESMFGVDALQYIQFEIERRHLNDGEATPMKGRDRKGDEREVKVNLGRARETEFKTAVWKGVFDYLIDAEIEAHRDWGSGYRHYDWTDIKKTSDALKVGEFATPEEIKEIREKTRTRARWVVSQDFAYALSTGGMEGLFNLIKFIVNDSLKG